MPMLKTDTKMCGKISYNGGESTFSNNILNFVLKQYKRGPYYFHTYYVTHFCMASVQSLISEEKSRTFT